MCTSLAVIREYFIAMYNSQGDSYVKYSLKQSFTVKGKTYIHSVYPEIKFDVSNVHLNLIYIQK